MTTHNTWAETDSEAFVWCVYRRRGWQTLEQIASLMGVGYKPVADAVSIWMNNGMSDFVQMKKKGHINLYRPSQDLTCNQARQAFAGRTINSRRKKDATWVRNHPEEAAELIERLQRD